MLPLTAFIIITAKGVVITNAGRVVVYQDRQMAELVARDSGSGNRVVEVVIDEGGTES